MVTPPHLPGHAVTRNDILDCYIGIERFDRAVEQALTLLQSTGQLDQTIVVVTSDHGMPFPDSKAALYDYGSRVPLAVCWPVEIPPGRTVDDFVSLSDLAPTPLEACGLAPHQDMTARSLPPVLRASKSGQVDAVPTKTFMMESRGDPAVERLAELAFGRRPAHEL